NPSPRSATKISFNANHASVIKSLDGGRTWVPTASLERPTFPDKRFPTPFFVQFGRDYTGDYGDGERVYAISNDGGWNNWNRMFLGRVHGANMGALDAGDWEYYSAPPGAADPEWTRDVQQAVPVFEHRGYTGMTGVQYIPAIKRFVMGQWSYIAMRGG